jgi:hypothetical protein
MVIFLPFISARLPHRSFAGTGLLGSCHNVGQLRLSRQIIYLFSLRRSLADPVANIHAKVKALVDNWDRVLSFRAELSIAV